LLCWITQTEEDLLCAVVVNGAIKVWVILRAPVQHGLRTDRLCIFDIGIGTSDRHVEAAIALIYDNHNDNRIVLFWLFGVGSVTMFAFNRKLKNALGYQIV
jgi:hypothetical protein